MKTETVKAIFTNLLFVIGVILIIYGFVQGSMTAVRLLTFEKYPLNSYEETRCDMEYLNSKAFPDSGSNLTEEERAAQKNTCLESVEHERQVRKTEHIVSSFTTLVSGLTLVIGFRKFIFK